MLDETATKLSPRFDNFLLQTIGHFGTQVFLEIQIAIDRQFRPELLVNAKLREDTYMEDEEEVYDLTMYKIHNQVHHEPLRADKPFVSFLPFVGDNDSKHIMVYEKLKDYVDSPGNL